MKSAKSFIYTIVVIALIVILSCFYTVREGQQAMVLQFGKIVKNSEGQPYVAKPGLHFKWPLINQVRTFDTRLQTLTVDSSRIITRNQKIVIVDYYVKWRIDNLPLFYVRTGGLVQNAERLLQQKTNNGLRAEFGKRTVQEVISGERLNVMALLSKVSNESAQSLGIKVIDVRIKGIDLPPRVNDSIFKRMSTKREQVAAQHRADGKSAAEAIKANADAKVTVIGATAKEEAAKIRAAGQAKAAQIYANAYGKDQRFYALYRSLKAYKSAFNNKDDVIVIKPDNQFFKYFNQSGSGAAKP